jgi:LPS sulfotransferase NodH
MFPLLRTSSYGLTQAHEKVPQPWHAQGATYGRAVLARLDPRPDAGRLLIFGQGRTGSTLLGSLLASHPALHYADEVLGRNMLFPNSWIEGGRARHRREAYAIHVKLYQVREQQCVRDVNGWLRHMHDRGWHVAYLRRDNLFRHVLSNMVAGATGAFHVHSDVQSTPQVQVDIPGLIHFMYARQQLQRDERAALQSLPHLEMTYEQDLLDPNAWQTTADRVFDVLGLPSATVRASLRRTGTADLSDVVANLDDVRRALRGLGWEHYLEQP